MKNLLIPLSVALIALAPAQDASAQAYPTKPIRLLVPFPAGGSNDIIARVIGQKLSAAFSQQVVVDNRGGASGIIAAELAAGANPDGYTLLFGGAGVLATTPVIHLKLRYDPIRDFAPVSLIATAPYMLVTNPSLPVKTARDIIALAKARPGQLNYASGGVGGPPHLTAELFKSMSGIDIVHIPYTGGAQATIGTLRGEAQLYFASMVSAIPLAREGKLRGIGVTSLKRSATIPELPTVAESGVPGYEFVTWFAIVAPVATPKPVIARLHAEIVKAINAADARKRFFELATDPVGSTPGELSSFNVSEIAKARKLIRQAGITPE